MVRTRNVLAMLQQNMIALGVVSLTWVPTTLTQSVIPVGGALFIVAQLLSLPEVLRQARGAGIADAEMAPLAEAAK